MSNIQIPNLGAAIALNGTEQLEAVQAGTSVKLTIAQIGSYITSTYPAPGVSSIATSAPITGGTITSAGTIGLAGAGVTNFYLASMSPGTVKANVTGGSAQPTDATPSAVLDLIGSTRGSILYRGVSSWSALPPGDSGYVLATNGLGADPSWIDPATAGTAISVNSTPVLGGTSGRILYDNVGLVGEYTPQEAAVQISADYVVADLAALKALAAPYPAAVQNKYRAVAGDGGGGTWVFRTGDQSANVSADAQSGLWAAPNSAPTGASGAWQRQFDGPIDAAWFGFATGNSGSANSTALNAAITAAYSLQTRVVRISREGTYDVTSAIAMRWHTSLEGCGEGVCILRQTTASTPVITLADSNGYTNVQGLTLDRAVAATAGGHGIDVSTVTGACSFSDLVIQNQYYGLNLGPTEFGNIQNVVVQYCYSNGVNMFNTASNGILQWQLFNVLSQMNNGRGFSVVSTNIGPTQIVMANWIACYSYANSGIGAAFIGLSAIPIQGVRLYQCFFGSDGNSEVYFDTYGTQHQIDACFFELPGTAATGRGLATAASNQGYGVFVTANNGAVTVTGTKVNGASYSGLKFLGGQLYTSNCSFTNNGVAGVSGEFSGVSVEGGTATISGGQIGNILGSTYQKIGVNIGVDAVQLTGVDLRNNATTPIYETVPVGAGSLFVGCMPASVNNYTSTTEYIVDNLAAIKAITAPYPAAVENKCRATAGDDGGGTWVFRSGNQSANVSADTQSGVWAAPNSDSTGASGAWQRSSVETYDIRWFGASVSGTAAANTTAIQAAVTYVGGLTTGGVVYIPTGSFALNDEISVALNKNVVFQGNGPAASILRQTNATKNGLKFTRTNYYPGGGVRDLTVEAGTGYQTAGYFGTGSSGTGIYLDGCADMFELNDVGVNNFTNGVQYLGCWNTRSYNVKILFCASVGVTIDKSSTIGIGASNQLLGFKISNLGFTGDNSASTGVRIRATGGEYIDTVDTTSVYKGWVIDPRAGDWVLYLFCKTCLADNSTSDGWTFDSSGGVIQACNFVDFWSAYNGGNGVVVTGSQLTNVHAAGRIRENAQNGLVLNGGGFSWDSGSINNNSRGNPNTYDGVSVAANVSFWNVLNSFIGNDSSSLSSHQRRGITIASGTGNYFKVQNNTFSANVTASISNGATGSEFAVEANVPVFDSAINVTKGRLSATLEAYNTAQIRTPGANAGDAYALNLVNPSTDAYSTVTYMAYVSNPVIALGRVDHQRDNTGLGANVYYQNANNAGALTTYLTIDKAQKATFAGALSTANQTITSSSANALAIGPNGTTNPAFNVDASTSSSATGINIKSAAAGSGVAVSAISSGANENLTIDAKGSGTITLGGTSTGSIVIGTGAIATNATDGFLYIPTCAGTPTGVPTAKTGRSPLVYDSTNNKLYIYNGGWKSATFA